MVNAIYFEGYFQFVLKCHLYHLHDSFPLFLYFSFIFFFFKQDLLIIFKLLQTLVVYFALGRFCVSIELHSVLLKFSSASVSPAASFSGKALNDFFRAFGLHLLCTHNQPHNMPSVLINSLRPPV